MPVASSNTSVRAVDSVQGRKKKSHLPIIVTQKKIEEIFLKMVRVNHLIAWYSYFMWKMCFYSTMRIVLKAVNVISIQHYDGLQIPQSVPQMLSSF